MYPVIKLACHRVVLYYFGRTQTVVSDMNKIQGNAIAIKYGAVFI
jgi:hypothetical protein